MEWFGFSNVLNLTISGLNFYLARLHHLAGNNKTSWVCITISAGGLAVGLAL